MRMLSIRKMIESAEQCLGWPYVSPGSNDANGIDCSGLFVKIYRDQGARIYHGSNTIYREYCGEDKGPIVQVSELAPGMAIFKWNPNTPEKFSDGLGDFQHIGLVISVNPLKIIQASSAVGCVTTDTKLGKWAYYGRLKDVDYASYTPDAPSDEGSCGELPVFATVYSENRQSVKMRSKPSTSCALYDELPFGTIVEIVKRGDVWSQVNFRNRKGWYIQSRFLLIDEASIPELNSYTVEIGGLSKEEADELLLKYPHAEISCG